MMSKSISINKEKLAKEMVQQFLNTYELVMNEIRQVAGKTPEPYKDLEINVLELFFSEMVHETANGLDFISKMLSGLIVNQALPNTNHRTSTYYITSILKQHGLNIDSTKNVNIIREYYFDSKHILHKGRHDYKEKHLEASRQFIINILGTDQSGKLGNMGANSFIISFNASSKDSKGS